MNNKFSAKFKARTWLIPAIALLVTIFLILINLSKPSPAGLSSNEIKNARKDSLQYCFLVAEMHIRENLKDPDSYIELESMKRFNDSPNGQNHIMINIRYKAKRPSGQYTSTRRCFDFNKSMELVSEVKCP